MASLRPVVSTDQAALIACMAYIDLNPIRAKVADRLANKRFTVDDYQTLLDATGRLLKAGPRPCRECHGGSGEMRASLDPTTLPVVY